MSGTDLIVDGTNVAWAWPKSRVPLLGRDYAAAQRLLVGTAAQSQLRSDYRELTFVFDGAPPQGGPSSSAGLRVLYPDMGQSADDRIVDLVAQAVHHGRGVVVATSDRELRDRVRTEGGSTMGGMALILKVDPRSGAAAGRSPAEPLEGREKPGPSSSDTASWLERFSAKRRPPGKGTD